MNYKVNKKIASLLLVVCCLNSSFVAASHSSESCQRMSQEKLTSFGPSWDERRHYLPDYMSVQGTASGYLAAEQVMIEFNIETLRDSAGEALVKNNEIISKAISEMKNAGISENEFTTQNLRIFPSHKDQYDDKGKFLKTVLEGYKVENTLKFISKKIELSGKVIDIAINSGINNIPSVKITPTQTKVKELKDSLISVATEDAVRKAKLALDPLGYEIKSVKSINMDGNSGFSRAYKFQTFGSHGGEGSDSNSDETQLFHNSEKYSVSVNVQFVIARKEAAASE